MSDLVVNFDDSDENGPLLVDQINRVNGYLQTLLTASTATNTPESGVLAAGGTQAISAPSVNTRHFFTFGAGNATFTFPAAVAGKTFLLALKQDSVGSRTVTWPSSATVRWPAATAPTLTTAANKTDYFRFECSDGVHWDGYTEGLNY